MSYKFSKTSSDRLKTCHKDIQKVLNEAIKCSPIDFGIACGHRSVEEQQRLFKSGRETDGPILTKVDGIKVKSKHNKKVSEAVDVYAYYNGAARWDHQHMSFLGGLILGIAAHMFKNGEITHEFRWGGDFNQNGIIGDQKFKDLPHFEIIKPKTTKSKKDEEAK